MLLEKEKILMLYFKLCGTEPLKTAIKLSILLPPENLIYGEILL